MKKILNIAILLLIAIGMVNCEDESRSVDDIALTPVLEISDIQLPEGLSNSEMQLHKALKPYGVNVYMEKARAYKWKDASHLEGFDLRNFTNPNTELSTETEDVITFDLGWEEMRTIEEVVDETTGETRMSETSVTVTEEYVLTIEKETGNTTVEITRTALDVSEVVSYSVTLTETEKYFSID